MENDKLYIGDKAVNSVEPDPDNDSNVLVELQGHQKINMKKKLFDLIAKNEKGNGNIIDCVNAYIAKEFLFQLAEYGLEQYQVEGVVTGVVTLAHNLIESKIGEIFKCANSSRVRLEDIVK